MTKFLNNSSLQQEIVWLLNGKYNGKLTKAAERGIERLRAGEPIDYVLGYKMFLGCKIDLRYKPLIPRDETEFWVERVVRDLNKQRLLPGCPTTVIASPEVYRGAKQSRIQDKRDCFATLVMTQKPSFQTVCRNDEGLKFLDVFAGTGCIGIAVLKHIKNSHCDFCDNDDNVIKQIKLNLKINKISPKKYRVIKSDIFSNVETNLGLTELEPPTSIFPPFLLCGKGGKSLARIATQSVAGEKEGGKINQVRKPCNYDCIFANPPYINFKRKNKVQKSVLRYEPRQALLSKDKGLFHIKKFLQKAYCYLKKSGIIYLEFDSWQKKDIEKIIRKNGYRRFSFHKDQFGKYRYAIINS